MKILDTEHPHWGHALIVMPVLILAGLIFGTYGVFILAGLIMAAGVIAGIFGHKKPPAPKPHLPFHPKPPLF